MPAILFSIIGSRIGQLGLAFLVGWSMAWWKTDAGWRATVAAEKAAAEARYQAEIARQRAASAEIAAEATQRLEYETTRANDMAARIRELQLAEAKNEPKSPIKLECKDNTGKLAPVIVRPCRIERSDVEFLRQLDASPRPPGSSKATENIRSRGQ